MNKNWIITTLLLYLAVIAVLGSLLLNRKSSVFVAPPTVVSKEAVPRKSLPRAVPGNYELIAKNDLFHPARGKEESEAENVSENRRPRPPGRHRFDLLGVFRTDDNSGALIMVSGNPPGRGEGLKKADGDIFLRGAEIVEGHILQQVGSTSVTILHNGETMVVEMDKFKTPGEEQDTAATRITQQGLPHERRLRRR